MGKHKDPPEIAYLKGAQKKNPGRYKAEVPKSGAPIGKFPNDASTDPAECWDEIASYCIAGVLTGADRIMLEMASNLLAEYRLGPLMFQAARQNLLVSLLARFGMSPSDRNSLGITPPEGGPKYGKL